jgi:hypothetical protein
MKMILPQVVAPKAQVETGIPGMANMVGALVTHPEFQLRPGTAYNTVVLAYALDDDERAKIAAGADLYVNAMTFAHDLPMLVPIVGKEAACDMLKLEVGTPTVLAARVETRRKDVQRAVDAYQDAMNAVNSITSVGMAGGDELEVAKQREHETLQVLDAAMTELARARVEAGAGIPQL